jgi:putative oxidoreductase
VIADGAALVVAGRLLIVAFFVIAGLCNLTPARIRDHIDRAAAARTPLPAVVFWFGIALQFVSCALILVGWHVDLGVIGLIVFTVAATAIYHRFWQMADPGKRNGARLGLLNNLAILGGLLLLLEAVR